jgi:hypothetical protein
MMLATLAIYASCPCEQAHSPDKIYISAEQVLFVGKKIWVMTPNVELETPAIFADEQGLYILGPSKNERCESPNWKCSYCGQCNRAWYSRCPSCETWR